MPSFGDDEIDGLVGEVGDIEAPPLPVEAPLAAAAPAVPAEDGAVWLGAPEGDDSASFADPGSTYGSNVSIEDLLNADRTEPRVAPLDPPSAPEPSWRDEPAFGSGFEIDRGFDPEWSQPQRIEPTPATPIADTPPLHAEPEIRFDAPAEIAPLSASDDAPIAPFPIPTSDQDEGDDDEVLLTEVASGDDLFNDPTLEIARLASGGSREIIVPVLLGEGVSARRYKLAIRLRLEPVE